MVSKADSRACGVIHIVSILYQISKDRHQKGSGKAKTTQAQLPRMPMLLLPLTGKTSKGRFQTLLIPSKQQPLPYAIATWTFSCQTIHILSGVYSPSLEYCCELMHTQAQAQKKHC